MVNLKGGFFNSFLDDTGNGDRRYSADDLSGFFSGLISDGIFSGYADGFLVVQTDTPSMAVVVKPGKAYFNKRWMLLDSPTSPIDISSPPTTASVVRIDTIALKVDDSQRTCTIEVIAGDAGTGKPKDPTPGPNVYYYAIAFVSVKNGATSITTADIVDRRGTFDDEYSYAPYSQSILNTMDPEKLINKLSENIETNLIPQIQNEIQRARAAAEESGEDYFQPADIRLVNIELTDDERQVLPDESIVNGWYEEKSSPTYRDYPWRFDYHDDQISASDIPTVIFSYDDFKMGLFCPFANTPDVGSTLSIFASSRPIHQSGKTVIPVVTLSKAVTTESEED